MNIKGMTAHVFRCTFTIAGISGDGHKSEGDKSTDSHKRSGNKGDRSKSRDCSSGEAKSGSEHERSDDIRSETDKHDGSDKPANERDQDAGENQSTQAPPAPAAAADPPLVAERESAVSSSGEQGENQQAKRRKEDKMSNICSVCQEPMKAHKHVRVRHRLFKKGSLGGGGGEPKQMLAGGLRGRAAC